MELQSNLSDRKFITANNILQMNQKLNFRVMFQRVCFEQFKQIDNYFDKFGYAINDFKAVNYNIVLILIILKLHKLSLRVMYQRTIWIQ